MLIPFIEKSFQIVFGISLLRAVNKEKGDGILGVLRLDSSSTKEGARESPTGSFLYAYVYHVSSQYL